jgi:sugar/nucleoside kinase (ribokinase family)
MNILVVGYNAFDVIVPVTGLPRPDSKQGVNTIHVGGGGPAATAAVALARLGARVRLVTVLTDDLPGLLQRQELDAAEVDLSCAVTAPGYRSAKAVILVDSQREQRTIFWSRGDLPHIAADAVSEAWLDETDLLYCDGHEPFAAIRLATAAHKRGLPVVFDAGSVRDGSRELVRCCSDVISSTDFAPTLTGCIEPAAALRALSELGPRYTAMTFGKAGCLALVDQRIVHVPAFEVPVKDTTGAGDVFHAGYAWARASGRDWLDSLTYGSATAALKCTDWGGRRGLPTAEQVETLLRTGRRCRERPPGYE